MDSTILRDMLVYFCKKYPHKYHLSKARITKMVYLADWKYAIDHTDSDEVLSGLQWVFNHYGPYVEDVYNCAKGDESTFTVKQAENFYGHPKEMIEVSVRTKEPILPEDIRKTLDHIIKITEDLSWNDFIRLVYSTHPIVSQERYAPLDIVSLAREYKGQ